MTIDSLLYDEVAKEMPVDNSKDVIVERNNYAQPQNIDDLQCYPQSDKNEEEAMAVSEAMNAYDAADQLLAAEEASHMSVDQAEQVLIDQRSTELEKEQADEILALADVSSLNDRKAEEILASRQYSMSKQQRIFIADGNTLNIDYKHAPDLST